MRCGPGSHIPGAPNAPKSVLYSSGAKVRITYVLTALRGRYYPYTWSLEAWKLHCELWLKFTLPLALPWFRTWTHMVHIWLCAVRFAPPAPTPPPRIPGNGILPPPAPPTTNHQHQHQCHSSTTTSTTAAAAAADATTGREGLVLLNLLNSSRISTTPLECVYNFKNSGTHHRCLL